MLLSLILLHLKIINNSLILPKHRLPFKIFRKINKNADNVLSENLNTMA